MYLQFLLFLLISCSKNQIQISDSSLTISSETTTTPQLIENGVLEKLEKPQDFGYEDVLAILGVTGTSSTKLITSTTTMTSSTATMTTTATTTTMTTTTTTTTTASTSTSIVDHW